MDLMLSSALRCLASMNLFLLALGLVAQLHGRTCAYHSGPQFLAQHRNNQTERNRDLDTLKGGSGSAWVTKLESSGSQDGGKIKVGRVRGEPGLGHWRGREMSELGKSWSGSLTGMGRG